VNTLECTLIYTPVVHIGIGRTRGQGVIDVDGDGNPDYLFRVTLSIVRGHDVVLDLQSTGRNPLALMTWAYARAVDFFRRGS
jgi:hypothetical protein